MKIKSIAAICKKNKNIAIFERYSDDGDILTQYIGDGSAVYPVVGLPQLDKESLLTIFDVPEKDRDNYFVKTLGVPAGISFEDTDETERRVEREGMSDKKKCPFCEAIALQRFIEEHHSKPAGFGMALSAALVSYAVVNGRKCGRTTDYMKDGKGYPLNYCPSCGKRVKNE